MGCCDETPKNFAPGIFRTFLQRKRADGLRDGPSTVAIALLRAQPLGVLELTEVVYIRVLQMEGDRMTEREQRRLVNHRLAVLQHAEEVTGNVAQTCRYYGISRRRFTSGVTAARRRDLRG